MNRSISLLMALLVSTASVAQAEDTWATVQQVIDGDTIVALVGEARVATVVRLLGIDAPEEFRPNQPKSKWAQAARYRLAELILDKRCRLVMNPGSNRDKYGRILAYVRTEDDWDVNGILISRGYALHYRRFTHPRMDEFDAFEEEAKKAKRGVWKSKALAPGGSSLPGSLALLRPKKTIASTTAPEPETKKETPKKVRYFVSVTDRVHRTDCENEYVQRDIKAKDGKFHDTYEKAAGKGATSCKLCRPYLSH